jgi:hypothetical protein
MIQDSVLEKNLRAKIKPINKSPIGRSNYYKWQIKDNSPSEMIIV